MKFVIQLYRKQLEAGRVFLHEHPASAKSWSLAEVQDLAREQGVTIYRADQCMYGLKTWARGRKEMVAAKKPTKFMTNSRALGRQLEMKCDGKHQHQSLVDGRAASAARYPEELCKAICRYTLTSFC